MLSLWKLRVGAEEYYLGKVARGIDDDYSGAGETLGTWIGIGVERLGLAGAVTGDDLREVLAGLRPRTGLAPEPRPAAVVEGPDPLRLAIDWQAEPENGKRPSEKGL